MKKKLTYPDGPVAGEKHITDMYGNVPSGIASGRPGSFERRFKNKKQKVAAYNEAMYQAKVGEEAMKKANRFGKLGGLADKALLVKNRIAKAMKGK
jgi:hypothetical protein